MYTPITDERLESFRRNTKRPNLEMEIAPLSFYVRGELVKITDKGVVDYWVVTTSDLDNARWTLLDGSSDNIHTANELCGLRLTEGNVLDYLQFFCDFLDMEDGRLRITGTGIVQFDNHKIVPTIRSTFNGMDEGKFLCAAHVIYAGAVMEAEFSIPPDGRTEMISDRWLEPVTVH